MGLLFFFDVDWLWRRFVKIDWCKCIVLKIGGGLVILFNFFIYSGVNCFGNLYNVVLKYLFFRVKLIFILC